MRRMKQLPQGDGITIQAEGWSPAPEEKLGETTLQGMLLNPGPEQASCECRMASLCNNKQIHLMISRDDMHHMHHEAKKRDGVTDAFSQDTMGLLEAIAPRSSCCSLTRSSNCAPNRWSSASAIPPSRC